MHSVSYDTEIYTENNLFLVKRLIQRIDMRNPDLSPKRYTSLAWAVVEGNEDMFEFLLNAGHDDEELTRVQSTRSFPNSAYINF
jgi:ankyrin repeat protein